MSTSSVYVPALVHAVPEYALTERTFPCGLVEAREIYGARGAALTVTTRPGDVVTCPGCMAVGK